MLRPLPSLRPPLRRGERRKVDKMQTVRFGSARYSVPAAYVGHQVEVSVGDAEVVVTTGEREIARHSLRPPGGASVLDEHYGGSRVRPRRPVRVRMAVERDFLELGRGAEAFLRAAAAAGTPRLAGELADIVGLERSWGREALVAALARALDFRRFRAQDVRSILSTNGAVPRPTAAGSRLELVVPECVKRHGDSPFCATRIPHPHRWAVSIRQEMAPRHRGEWALNSARVLVTGKPACLRRV